MSMAVATMAPGTKRRWTASAAVAAVVVAGTLGLFRAPVSAPSGASPSESPPPAVRFTPGRGDELVMRDLAPLFLPTRHNAALPPLPQTDPGRGLFEGDAEKLPANPNPELPTVTQVPGTPADALFDTRLPLASGIGRTDLKVSPLEANGGRIDVFGADRNRSLLRVVLPAEARPKSGARDSVAWQPLEFTASIDSTGLVGPLLLTRSSGLEEVDTHYRIYLAQSFRLGDRLPPGVYRIVVGP